MKNFMMKLKSFCVCVFVVMIGWLNHISVLTEIEFSECRWCGNTKEPGMKKRREAIWISMVNLRVFIFIYCEPDPIYESQMKRVNVISHGSASNFWWKIDRETCSNLHFVRVFNLLLRWKLSRIQIFSIKRDESPWRIFCEYSHLFSESGKKTSKKFLQEAANSFPREFHFSFLF